MRSFLPNVPMCETLLREVNTMLENLHAKAARLQLYTPYIRDESTALYR